MKFIFTIILIITISINANAQGIKWEKSFGGSQFEFASCVQQTNDAGYIILGYTFSNDGDIIGKHGTEINHDLWVVKTDSIGAIIWKKCYGGNNNEFAASIQQTNDGGYVISGSSNSLDGDVIGNHGSSDIWIVKLDNSGSLQWQKSLGGSDAEHSTSIQQTADGGYIITGVTKSNDGDVSGHHTLFSDGGGAIPEDCWVVKLDNTGSILWQKCLGGSGMDIGNNIQQTADGGFIIGAETRSNDGDVIGNHGGITDGWLVKLDNNGAIQWQKTLGGSGDDNIRSIQQTIDGGFIAVGASGSDDGDVSGHHEGYHFNGESTQDIWVVKLDNSGGVQWQKCFGGSKRERAYSISQTIDGGYIVGGLAYSNDGDLSESYRGDSSLFYWVLKLDLNGVVQWQRTLGGSSANYGCSIKQTFDGNYIFSGSTGSANKDAVENHGSNDYWLVKFCTSDPPVISTNPSNAICPGDTTYITSSPTLNYLWNNGDTLPSTIATSFGYYGLSTTDNMGCRTISNFINVLNKVDNFVSSNTFGSFFVTSYYSGSSYQWLDCNNEFAPMIGDTNQTFTPENFGSYALVASSFGCLTDTSSCFYYYPPPLSINKNKLNHFFSIFPNPTSGSTAIVFNNNVQGITINIFNSIGQKVIEESNLSGTRFNIEMGNQNMGIFIVEVILKDEIYRTKLIKK